MAYQCTEDCLLDLERNGHLVRIKKEVSADLEMAAIHRRVYDAQGPAIWFENIKDCKFPAASNLFGTMERSRFIFRHRLAGVKKLVSLKADPSALFKNPLSYLSLPAVGLSALPLKARFRKPVLYLSLIHI